MSSPSNSTTLVDNPPAVKAASPTDVFFQTMQRYVADMPCSPLKRQKLDDLITQMLKEWTNILSGKETMPTPGCATPSLLESTPKGSDQRDLLRQFSQDVIRASVSAAMKSGSDGPTHYQLTREYTFNAALSLKAPFKKPIFALIGVSSSLEVVLIKYPGQRTSAVDVGYCRQYDSEVFFGNDGMIYLVECEQMRHDLPVSNGIKVFESDMKLDSDWRTFALEYDE